MENSKLSPNPEVNQLPEVDSLPDGFVESSSAAPLEEKAAENDYKEEKLLDPGSRSEVVIEDGGSLVGYVDDHSDLTAAENVAVASGAGNVKGKSVDSAESQRVASEDISAAATAENVTSEVKRKNVKRTSKSEKEVLDLTLRIQQLIVERDSVVAVKDKLESLCRELQRQNKLFMSYNLPLFLIGPALGDRTIPTIFPGDPTRNCWRMIPLRIWIVPAEENFDECKRVSTEGQNLRSDLSDKFQDAIKDVSKKLEEQKQECILQLKENEMLKTKLKQLIDQYSLSEQQHAQQLKQKTLELQLAELKLKQHEERLNREQSQMKLYSEQVAHLLTTEKNLRLQLTSDGEKFQQFQEALVKSNEVFETFKQEIEKMAKSIKEYKKENTFLKSKCEKSDVALIELAEERERLKKQLEKTRNQNQKLESLCRSLQAERKANSVSSDSIPV
ncbi:hypothetical protein CASFOL_000505 [Castilleja foliolosa]|uniref:Alpha-taxilin n=1 Tax=Castilleja foliolosa TaxID=1961234 RepID=A0ABD3ESP7_9LAMI